MGTVPVFAPTGELGDIPAERIAEAQKAGFKVGVHVKSAEGQDGVIPASRTADAVKAGMKIVPISEQPSQHPGFFSALSSDLQGMLTSTAPPISKEGLLQSVKMFKEAITGPDPKEYLQAAIDRMNAGHGPAYASVAGAGQQLGVNVPGMERSAQQGDVGGVYGHAAAVPTAMAAGAALSQLPLGRIVRAGGSALQGGAERLPIVGPVAKGAIRGALKSWRESAPTTEIPPSKVSTTAPESSPAVSLNRLTSDIQSLGYSKADALARAKAGIAKYPDDLNAATTEAMRPSRVQASAAPTTAPPSKSAQVAQVKTETTKPSNASITEQTQAKWKESGFGEKIAKQNKASNVQGLQERFPQLRSGSTSDLGSTSKSDVLGRLRSNAQQIQTQQPSAQEMEGRPLRIAGEDVSANTELTSALQKSLPQNRVEGKIMQVLRKEGPNLTVGMDRLMQAKELQGVSREQVLNAARSLRDSAKVWGHTAGPNEDIVGIALRKR